MENELQKPDRKGGCDIARLLSGTLPYGRVRGLLSRTLPYGRVSAAGYLYPSSSPPW